MAHMSQLIEWSPLKNLELKQRYGFGLERVLLALSEGALLDEQAHPNPSRYPDQRVLIVAIEGYAWVIPFVFDDTSMFWKTMFPSRKATRKFLGDR